MLNNSSSAVTARRQALLRARDQQDEDATQLRLGPEFQNEHCLLHSEVKILLEKLKENTEAGLINEKHNLGTVFLRSLRHSQEISKFNTAESVKECRRILMAANSGNLEQFEIAQIANLMPESAEEAKTLIPSLMNRIEDDDLQLLLNELQNLKRFQ